MIVLNTTSDVVRVITALANSVDCHVTYVDNVASTPYLAARQNTAITTATTTTILGSPGASTQRQIKKLTIVAKGGGNTITIQLFDGTTAFLLFGNGIVIAVGETIEYEDVTGWRVTDANGQLKQTNLTPITLTGPVTGGPASGTIPTTIANIPNDTPVLGDLFFTFTAPPATPPATKGRVWFDSVSGVNLQVINSAGNKSGTAYAKTAVASNWLDSFDPTNGAFTQSQPAFSDISGSLPSGTTAAGYIEFAGIASPGAPAAGKLRLFMDSGLTAPHFIDGAGFNYNPITPLGAGVANQWVSFVDNVGVQHTAQPAFSNISGTVAAAQLPAVLVGIQVLTSGTTYTPTAGTKCQLVRGWAGGGGGGGASTTAVTDSAAGGGASGGYFERLYSITTTGTYAIGAAGTAGAAAAGTGGTGGNTTFTDGTTLCTAFGGLGGVGMAGAATTTALVALGGAKGAVSTNGQVNGIGTPGDYGIRVNGVTGGIASGNGASSSLGGGGQGVAPAGAATTGNSATGFASGGGGAGVGALNGSAAGGTGSAGVIIVLEFA